MKIFRQPIVVSVATRNIIDPHAGDSDGHKTADRASTVDFGGLIQGLVHVRQGRQIQDHVVGQALPQGDDHGTKQDEPLIRQERDRVESPRGQQVIDRAALIQEVAPGQGDDDQRGDRGQVVQCAEEADAGDMRLQPGGPVAGAGAP